MTATRAIAAGAAVVAGVGLAVQARLNGELGQQVGDGITAALATTTVGLIVLLALVPTTATGDLRWWQCTGGVAGALYVSSQGISVDSLGVAVSTVAVVGGGGRGARQADRSLLGIVAIGTATLVVRYVGVLVFGLASVAGQLLGAVAVDTVTGPRPTAATWLGTAVTLGAVVLAAGPRSRPARSAGPR